MNNELQIYRKRLIPEECILLKDDIIVEQNDDYILTKWKTLNPKTTFSHGCSCYYLKEGFKISKFYRHDGSLLYWYCDIVEYTRRPEDNALIVTDLLADIILYPDGRMHVVDLAPFFSWRAGSWNSNMICERLMNEMYVLDSDENVILSDPRLSFYFDNKRVGAPTQVTYQELVPYVDIVAHYNRGLIQNRDHFSIMCFSEIWFIWAEAAHRKWISGTAKSYYDRAVAESIYEWNPDASESIVSSFLSNPLVSLDGLRDDAALERIMTQKWISTVLVGIEAPPYGISRDAGQVACGQRRRAADSPALSCRRRVPQSRQLRRGRQRLAGRGEQHENRGLVG